MDLNTIRSRTLQLLGEPLPEPEVSIGPRDDSPALDRIIRAMEEKAAQGNVQAAKLIVDLTKLQEPWET